MSVLVNGGQPQLGVGMIEVLIALMVFSVGMLGLSAVQLAAGRSSYEASQRSLATALARDIFERIRSNPAELARYSIPELGAAEPGFARRCDPQNCSPAELAARDLYEWDQLLRGHSAEVVIAGAAAAAGGLLDARACITTGGGNVSVAITWRGVLEMENPTGSTCGEGSGLYGPDNLQRRLLFMSTFVGEL